MHELDIAKKISGVILKESQDRGFKKIQNVQLRIGITNAIDPKQLEFFLKENSDMFKTCLVNVDDVDVLLQCEKCKHMHTDERFSEQDFAHRFSHAPSLYIAPNCPKCNSEASQIVKGQELEIVSIEGE